MSNTGQKNVLRGQLAVRYSMSMLLALIALGTLAGVLFPVRALSGLGLGVVIFASLMAFVQLNLAIDDMFLLSAGRYPRRKLRTDIVVGSAVLAAALAAILFV